MAEASWEQAALIASSIINVHRDSKTPSVKPSDLNPMTQARQTDDVHLSGASAVGHAIAGW